METTSSTEGSNKTPVIATNVNTENAPNPKEENVKVKVSNLHRLVDADELRKFFEENQTAPMYKLM